MSRENESPSPTPNGRGSATPGTEPYGPTGASGEPEAAEREAKADEPKTETTLTTRVRINIPGSRPIPPVVMRRAVGEEESGAEDAHSEAGKGHTGPAGAEGRTPRPAPEPTGGDVPFGAGAASAAAAGAGAAGAEASGAEEAGGEDGEFTQETSEWFAPRKPKSRSTGGGPPGASAAGTPAAGTPAAGTPAAGTPAAGTPAAGTPAAGTPAAGTPTTGTPAAGTPVDGGGSGTQTNLRFPLGDTEPPPGGATGPADEPNRVHGLVQPPDTPSSPAGPTTGPATGEMRTPPAAPAAGPQGTPAHGTPTAPPPGPQARPTETTGADAANSGPPPAGSTLGLGTGPAPFAPGGAGEGMLDGGTPPDGTPVAGTPAVDERFAGSPVVSGAPAESGGQDTGASSPWPALQQEQQLGSPQQPYGPTPPPPAASSSAGTGRNKLVLIGVAVLGVLGIGYGAGLLFDHSDVPNGTTVLGVDIGGSTRHDAVNTLDEEFGDSATAPFKVNVDGTKRELKPSVAGITLDNEKTVQEASGRDYNPVTVIGSLFGMERDADPAVAVDEEKMDSALSQLPGGSSQVSEGMVKFSGGRAVAVPGKPYKGLDTTQASEALREAFLVRAESGENPQVKLPLSQQQPKVTKAQLNQAVNGFGKTAMSGWVWLKAGDVTVPFSEETLGTFLTMQVGGEKLQPVIDVKKLQAAYGTAFDGVVVKGGAGTVPMQPQHAAAAMTQALKKPAQPGQKRVAEVPGAVSQ